jgi:hypothetical protein
MLDQLLDLPCWIDAEYRIRRIRKLRRSCDRFGAHNNVFQTHRIAYYRSKRFQDDLAEEKPLPRSRSSP